MCCVHVNGYHRKKYQSFFFSERHHMLLFVIISLDCFGKISQKSAKSTYPINHLSWEQAQRTSICKTNARQQRYFASKIYWWDMLGKQQFLVELLLQMSLICEIYCWDHKNKACNLTNESSFLLLLHSSVIITSLTRGHSFHKTAHEMERFYSGPFQLFSPNLGIPSPQVSATLILIKLLFIYLISKSLTL